MVALAAMSGRGTIAMWGYPLWLFLGLWIVLFAQGRDRRRAPDADRARCGRAVFAVLRSRSSSTMRCCRLRSALPGGVLSGRPAGRRACAALPRRDRPAARLRDRRHVGRRQCRPLRARAAARADRRQSAARAVDRSRRPQIEGRCGGVDRRRSGRHAGRRCAPSPATPRCSRRSRCRFGAAMPCSRSAGRFCGRSPRSRMRPLKPPP